MFIAMFILFIISIFMTIGSVVLYILNISDLIYIILSIFFNISFLNSIYLIALMDKNNNEIISFLKDVILRITQENKSRRKNEKNNN